MRGRMIRRMSRGMGRRVGRRVSVGVPARCWITVPCRTGLYRWLTAGTITLLVTGARSVGLVASRRVACGWRRSTISLRVLLGIPTGWVSPRRSVALGRALRLGWRPSIACWLARIRIALEHCDNQLI